MSRILNDLKQAYSGCRAVNVLRIASVVAVTETVTIGPFVYEAWLGGAAVTAGNIKVDLSAGGTKASGTLTSNNTQVTANDTVTLGNITYKFVGSLTGAANEVLLQTDADTSLTNLALAINGGAGIGVKYGTGTVANPLASSSSTPASHVITFTSLLTGTGGNAIVFTKSAATLTAAGSGTLASGANPTGAQAVTALVLAIGSTTGKTFGAVAAGANEMLLFTLRAGNFSLACTETLAGSNNAWHAAATYGGEGQKIVAANVSKRVPNAGEVALGNMHFEFPFAPNAVLVQIIVTSTGVQKTWDGARTITGNRVTLDNTGSTDWAATDTVVVMATE